MSSTSLSLVAKGVNFARVALSLAHAETQGGGLHQAMHHADTRWPRSAAAECLKAAVAAGSSAGDTWGHELSEARTVARDFLEYVRPRTILGRLDALRRVPANVRVRAQTGGFATAWVGEGAPAPVSMGAFDVVTLANLKVAGIIIESVELLRTTSAESEAVIRNDLAAAAREATDSAFIDPANAGSANVKPASVTHNAPTLQSSGDVADDVEAAIAAFTGNLETSAWVLHPRTAVQMGLRAGGRGLAADLGARGGTLAGMPAITSQAVPFASDGGLLVLLDAADIAVADDSAGVSSAQHATLQLDSAPDNPGQASTVLISLWQRGYVGFRVYRDIDWRVGRVGSVVVVANAAYPAP